MGPRRTHWTRVGFGLVAALGFLGAVRGFAGHLQEPPGLAPPVEVEVERPDDLHHHLPPWNAFEVVWTSFLPPVVPPLVDDDEGARLDPRDFWTPTYIQFTRERPEHRLVQISGTGYGEVHFEGDTLELPDFTRFSIDAIREREVVLRSADPGAESFVLELPVEELPVY